MLRKINTRTFADFMKEILMTDPRDFLNKELEKMAIEAAKDVEFKILLGCRDCGRRLNDWVDDMMTNPRGYMVKPQILNENEETEVYCQECYDRRYDTEML